MTIPGRANIRLYPKGLFQRFIFENCHTYSSYTAEGVQGFGFANTPGGSGKIQLIHLGSTVTVVLSHLYMGIDVCIEGY